MRALYFDTRAACSAAPQSSRCLLQSPVQLDPHSPEHIAVSLSQAHGIINKIPSIKTLLFLIPCHTSDLLPAGSCAHHTEGGQGAALAQGEDICAAEL